MPLGTTWMDVTRLLFYGLLFVATFFAYGIFHSFLDNLIGIPYLGSIVAFAVTFYTIHRVFQFILSKTGSSQEPDKPGE